MIWREKMLNLKRCIELEQYSRKSTLKLEGIDEPHEENPFNTVLKVWEYLQLNPPMTLEDIDNCHRVGKVADKGPPRSIIVKFTSYRARKRLYDARSALRDHNQRLKEATSDQQQIEVFEAPPPATDTVHPTGSVSLAQPTGRRPDSRVHSRNEPTPTPENSSDPASLINETPPEDDINYLEDATPSEPSTFISSHPVYINEALCKARSDLSYEARKLRKKGKINDTWSHDGKIKVRTVYNRIVTIESMADLEDLNWKSHIWVMI